MKAKRAFMDGYRTYSGEGGNARQWRAAFSSRMNLDEARSTVSGYGTPREILGVSASASWSEIKSAYRRRALDVHPDRAAMNGMSVAEATEAFKRLTAAFTLLQEEFGQ